MYASLERSVVIWNSYFMFQQVYLNLPYKKINQNDGSYMLNKL